LVAGDHGRFIELLALALVAGGHHLVDVIGEFLVLAEGGARVGGGRLGLADGMIGVVGADDGQAALLLVELAVSLSWLVVSSSCWVFCSYFKMTRLGSSPVASPSAGPSSVPSGAGWRGPQAASSRESKR
jgi:hypothetical protein